jgi:Periplasmic protein TonB, links inner and outer membranes
MQRLARFKLQEINQNVTALFAHYDEIIKILRSHLPPSTATLFAKPETKADQVTVEWYSELEGQPVLIAQEMQEEKQFKPIISLIQQRLNAIVTLNQELMTKGVLTPEQSAWLAQLVEGATHDTRQIYLVNNEPVITGWGIGKKVEPPAPPPVVPLTAPKHRWCYWLLPLLLLLLGLLAWWWLNREPVVPPKVEPPKFEEPKKEEPKPEPPKEEPKVEEPKPEPVQEPPKEEPKVEEPKPEPKKNCRVVEKPTDAPQMAIIFNNASGMRYTLLESAKKVAIFDEKLRNPAKYGITQQDIYYMERKPNRSVASKKSVAELINNIPTAVDIGLVELKSCLSTSKKASYATNHGIFTAAQRSTLKAKLNKMQVRNHRVPGTPIYEGLQKALTMVDGKEREALIVLITEGNGDCTNRSACELIKKEAKERPKLKINIVNINSPWHNTDCLAKTTGGEILNGDMTNQVKLTEAIKKSMEPVQQEICDE